MARAEFVFARAALLSATRSFFDERNYVEVDTPVLTPALVPEPSLEVFVTEVLRPSSDRRYLVPSPELWMKRLLGAGLRRIYQISHAFRNLEEQGAWHRPEFSILEWYDTGTTWVDAQAATTDLLQRVAARLRVVGTQPVAAIDATPLAITMADLCAKAVGETLVGQSAAELRRIATDLSTAWQADDSWEVLFHRIFLEHVEGTIPVDRPVFVTDYPSGIVTMARTASGAVTSERWELYLNGIELANCYQEETDPERLRQLFRAETVRMADARTPRETDWELIDAFANTPACSGVALGMDRLLALALGEDGLARVLPFG